MSDLFQIGSSAVTAYRIALNAIGENVANSETQGYSRREVRLQEIKAPRASTLEFGDPITFGGVRAGSVGRAWDAFRATDARLAASAAGRAQVRERWLTAGEGAMNDGPSGPGALIGNFFNAGLSLAASPDDTLGRRSMLMALQDAAASLRDTAEALKRVSGGIGDSAKIEVDGLNADLAALAVVNRQLRQEPAGTATRAGIEDERDRLLGSIANRIEIDVKVDEKGAATVSVAGAQDKLLVESAGANRVSLEIAGDGRLALGLIDGASLSSLPLASGSLAGLADAATVTADRRAELDSIAASFAATVNAWSAGGLKEDGSPGGPLLEMTAGAASLRVLTSDPADIAAASADGSSANGNLLALNGLRGGDGPETRWANLVAGHAILLASAKSEASAAATNRDNSFAALDDVTGVDLDREAAELMRFQQAYNAATRIIQVGRDTTQSILDLF